MNKEQMILRAKEIVNSGIITDKTVVPLQQAASSDVNLFIEYLKGIAEQAWDPKTTNITIKTYGEELVNISKQFHPKPDWLKTSISEQKIKGGKGDKKSLNDIAKKFNVTITSLKKELSVGINIEMEHTKNKSTAEDIAMDHLTEMPDYYTRLTKMEKTATKHWENKEINEIKILIKKLIREGLNKIT